MKNNATVPNRVLAAMRKRPGQVFFGLSGIFFGIVIITWCVITLFPYDYLNFFEIIVMPLMGITAFTGGILMLLNIWKTAGYILSSSTWLALGIMTVINW